MSNEFCPAHMHEKCPKNDAEGTCEYCGYDFEEPHLTEASFELAKDDACGVASQKRKNDEQRQARDLATNEEGLETGNENLMSESEGQDKGGAAQADHLAGTSDEKPAQATKSAHAAKRLSPVSAKREQAIEKLAKDREGALNQAREMAMLIDEEPLFVNMVRGFDTMLSSPAKRANVLPGLVRIGDFIHQDTGLTIPALFPIRKLPVAYKAPKDVLPTMANGLQRLAFRFVASLQSNQSRLVLVDCLGVGACFGALQSLDRRLTGDVLTNASQIAAGLDRIRQEIQERTRRIQSAGHDSWAKLIEADPDVKADYILVLLHGFPVGLTSNEVDTLGRIAEWGGAVGIHLALTWDSQADLQALRKDLVSDLSKWFGCIQADKDNCFELRCDEMTECIKSSFRFEPDIRALPADLTRRMSMKVNELLNKKRTPLGSLDALSSGIEKPLELVIGRHAGSDRLAMGSFALDRSVLSITDEHHVAVAACLLEGILLQVILQLPPKTARIWLHDDSATGAFSNINYLLAATSEGLSPIGEQWLTPRDVLMRLRGLEQELQRRAGRLAATRQPNIHAYNQGRRTQEPIVFVVLASLASLVAQDVDILHTIRRLAERGPTLGVVPVLFHDVDAVGNRGLTAQQVGLLREFLRELESHCFGFNFQNRLPPLGMGEPYQTLLLGSDFAPSLPEGQAKAWVEEILTARRANTQSNAHQDFLSVKVGEANGHPAYFSLGQATQAYNGMVSGGAGSGKTTFVQNVILSICEQYTPDQIQLVLLDYGTVSFAPYRKVAHVLTVFDQPVDGEGLGRLLQWLTQELHRRKEAFRRCGLAHDQTVDNLQTYARLTGDSLPRLLLVIDEFGSLMSNENTASAKVGERVMRVSHLTEQTINLIVREGRKVGMHIVLITQSFAKVERMPQDFKSNSHVAFGLKAETPQDSRALLNSENQAAYDIGAYQAVRNAQGGKVEGNIIIDLDYVTEDEITSRQAALRECWPLTNRSELDCIVAGRAEVGNNLGVDIKQTLADDPPWIRQRSENAP